ncbi:amino acid permease [Streptomyces sp. NBC_00237]|uniref:amino acid permease n=1 Tax=Streptomyces sp. NBC_00237 TaxID=2975687 RepID=UPI00225923F4|nr:amino acid permease [Streptomyces sp. NBC_00237]MCX5206716.1 amino acid permease [Streptomyces sp. NBC_00237]
MTPAPAHSGSTVLRTRHLTMLGLGGAIGSGLFVGSGMGIAHAGPAIVLSYLLAGGVTILVMRMLGELAAVTPDQGSFSTYAQKAFGPWAGFTVGWLHWWTLCVAIAAEATAAAATLHAWIPSIPQWAMALMVMSLFTGLNLAAVGLFGEFEFWFAGIKVAAILAFLVLGALAVSGALPHTDVPGLTNLTGHGGFLPHGWWAVVTGFILVLSSFGGMEVVTIAAAETSDPPSAVARAVRATVWRVLVFFVGSITVVITLLPWDAASVVRSPFVAVLDRLGVPAAAGLMDVVVLVALFSALNANVYAASRMAQSLGVRQQGPAWLASRSTQGVPRAAVLSSTGLGFLAVLLIYWWPQTVFPFLLKTIGATMLIVWLAIAGSQLVLRGKLEAVTPRVNLRVAMWWHPYLSWLAVAALAGALLLMAVTPETRPQLIATSAVTGVLLLIAALRAGRVGAPSIPAR